MSFEEKYRAELDQIKVPENLAQKTLQKMKNEQAEENIEKSTVIDISKAKKGSYKKSAKKTFYFAVPAIIAASFLIFFINQSPSSPIITSLTEGQHIGEVELSNGQLRFENIENQGGNIIQMDPNFGVNSENTTNISENELMEENFLIPKNWGEFVVSKKEYKSVFNAKLDMQVYQYIYLLAKDNESIEIKATNKMDSIPESNSNIGDIDMYLSYSAESKEYYAEFAKDNITYKITANNVSEKNFIEFLINFLK